MQQKLRFVEKMVLNVPTLSGSTTGVTSYEVAKAVKGTEEPYFGGKAAKEIFLDRRTADAMPIQTSGECKCVAIKGNSVVWNQIAPSGLTGTTTATLELKPGHIYILRNLYTDAIFMAEEDDDPVEFCECDNLFDLTLMFGTNERAARELRVPSFEEYGEAAMQNFREMYPLPLYDYCGGRIINADLSNQTRIESYSSTTATTAASTLYLPIALNLASCDTAYDLLEDGRTLYMRIGRQELSGLTWTMASSHTFVSTALPSASGSSILCSKYPASDAICEGFVTLTENSALVVQDSKFDTLTGFTAAIADGEVNYVLATGSTTTISEWEQHFTAYNMGYEKFLPANGSAPYTSTPKLKVRYKDVEPQVILCDDDNKVMRDLDGVIFVEPVS